MAALEQLAGTVGLDLPTLLARTARFQGWNAVLERRGARVGRVAGGHGEALQGRSIDEVFSALSTGTEGELRLALLVLQEHR